MLVLIAFPFAFHLVSYHSLFFTCRWISFVFLLHGRRICTHSVDPSLTPFLCEFPGMKLALVPDVTYSRNLDQNVCPGRGKISDLDIYRRRTLPLDCRTPFLLSSSYDMQEDTAGQL